MKSCDLSSELMSVTTNYTIQKQRKMMA